MKTPRTRISHVIAERLLASGGSKDAVTNIAAYLLSERRAGELDSIMRDVQAEWARQGHVEVLASSAHPLTDATRTDIEARVRTIYANAKTILVTEVHDPAVVGGVRLNLSDQQLDLSVQAKLNKFKQLTLSGKE